MAEPLGGAGRASRAAIGGRFVSALKRRPVLCLALLTPGIPEYLSSSSPVSNLFLNPAWFFLGLLINVGQYTAGALLVREAVIRWRKGWLTAGLLAVAYGITEEGLGDSTLFNSSHGADGVLGHFGRYVGVNWLWTCGVLAFHVIFSIGLPLLLLGLALPATKGRRLLGTRGVAVAFTTVAAATLIEALIVLRADGFWIGPARSVGAVAAIALLVAAGYGLPARWGLPQSPGPTSRSLGAGLAAFLLFPGLFAIEYGFSRWPKSAPVALVIDVALLVAFFGGAARSAGRSRNEHWMACLALGFLGFLAAFGVLLSRPFGTTLPLAALAIYFGLRMERAHRTPRTGTDSDPPSGPDAGT